MLDVFSDASIVSLVDRIVVPPSLISNVGMPELDTVFSVAATATTSTLYGNDQYAFPVPVVSAVVSSETAMHHVSSKRSDVPEIVRPGGTEVNEANAPALSSQKQIWSAFGSV